MKTIKFNKDKTFLLDGKSILTRTTHLKGGNWNECIKTEDLMEAGKYHYTPVYPTYYKIGDYYYV